MRLGRIMLSAIQVLVGLPLFLGAIKALNDGAHRDWLSLLILLTLGLLSSAFLLGAGRTFWIEYRFASGGRRAIQD